ncbi:ChrR family anti-sigma-E factor [Rhodobacteraceae bacterium NNCM2]|nr:ChrR family anti-sigma-E factor [Coraliihabitans acroporae]
MNKAVQESENTHRPSTEMLLDYASGAATPGNTLLIAAHLAQVPQSRDQVTAMEQVGGALLSSVEPVEMSEAALDDILAAIDGPEPEEVVRSIEDTGPLPQLVIDAVGVPFSKIPWKFRLPGVSEYVLEEYAPEKVSILRAKPGSAIPQHTHTGSETTLVMAGQMKDGDDILRAGDISIADEHHDHKPQIIGDEVCYCLVVMDGTLYFTGRFSRALNYLAE